MDLHFLGTIEPHHGATADQNAWIALIGAHPSLGPALPQQGINPFTRQAHIFNPSPGYASVLLDGTKVGAIHCAMDGSLRLVVLSVVASKAHVTMIAQDVASRLSWRFAVGTGS
jgi:hypothetical protein